MVGVDADEREKVKKKRSVNRTTAIVTGKGGSRVATAGRGLSGFSHQVIAGQAHFSLQAAAVFSQRPLRQYC